MVLWTSCIMVALCATLVNRFYEKHEYRDVDYSFITNAIRKQMAAIGSRIGKRGGSIIPRTKHIAPIRRGVNLININLSWLTTNDTITPLNKHITSFCCLSINITHSPPRTRHFSKICCFWIYRGFTQQKKGLSHINHVRQLFSCTKKASTLAKGRRQV